jgi:hypothetical protein
MDFTTIVAKVAKGASMLDTHRGGIGWVRDVNTETLRMSCLTDCLLGQLYGSWGEGCIQLGIDISSAEFGFDLYSSDATPANWSLLEIAWLDEIGKRVAELI